MRILIAGVSGRVGANLAQRLQGRGHDILGLVMPADPKMYKVEALGIECIESDIADAERVRAAVDGCDIVIHLAAQIREGIYSSERMLDINTRSTISLLEGALASSRPLKRFLFASTYQTYNPFVTGQVGFTEASPQQPRDLYALTKLLSEQICLAYMREYGVPVTLLRYCGIVAVNEVLGMLSPAWLNFFIELATAKNRIPWFGAEHVDEVKAIIAELLETPDAVCGVTGPTGTPWARTLVDVRDVVAGTLLALESDAAIGEAFNMVGPEPIAYTTAARLIAEHTGRPYRAVKMPFYRGPYTSNEKARAMLGYKPKYTFDKILASALAYQRGEDIDQIPN